MRLGVSPAAAPTPTGAFNQRFEALFPHAAAPVTQSASLPAIFPVYLCVSVGPWGATQCSACPILRHSESGPLGLSVRECWAAGSASGQTACPVRPTLRPSRSGSLLCLGCPCPPLRPVWMNVSFLSTWCRTSLLFDFLSVLVVLKQNFC